MSMVISLMSLGSNLFAANIFNQANLHSNEPFSKLVYDGVTYIPDKQTKPSVVYGDMEGDKKIKMVVAIQMLPVYKKGWFQTFAFVYGTDGKGHRNALLETIHLGDLLGAETGNDDQEKVIDVVDLNNDGKKAVALWSTSGVHYHHLIIIGMRGGKVVKLFDGGSDNQLKYIPNINKNIITAGNMERSGSDDAEKWREDVWEWNGKKFAYSKRRSSVTALKNGVAQ